jgi:hypothetical protein
MGAAAKLIIIIASLLGAFAWLAWLGLRDFLKRGP